MNRNILIFGGTHYFGKHLVSRLLANGDRVCISTRGNNPIPAGCSFIPFNRDSSDILQSSQHWDVVYDQSGYTAQHIHSIAPIIANCNNYVFTSSQAVYPSGLNLIEKLDSSTEGQLNNYGLEKRKAESLIQRYAARCIIPRFPVVVGENDRRCRLQNLIKTIYTSHITLPTSNPWLQTLDEYDASNTLFELPLHNFQGPINIASPDSLSVQQMCEIISGHLSVNLTIEWLDHYSYEPFDLIKSSSKTLCLQNQLQLGLNVKTFPSLLQQQCDAFTKQPSSLRKTPCHSA